MNDIPLYKDDLITNAKYVYITRGGGIEGLWAASYAFELEGTLQQNFPRITSNFSAVSTSSLGNIHKYAGHNRAIHHFFQYLTTPAYDPFSPVNYLLDTYNEIDMKEKGTQLYTRLKCFPSPFHPRLTICLDTKARIDGHIDLKVYSISGRLVKDLSQDLKAMPGPGSYQVTWKPNNRVPGMYIIHATLNKRSFSKKVILVR